MTQKVKDILSYCESLSRYKRRKTVTVKIGELLMGSDYPIRAQSMTTTDTMDTSGSVEQIIRMVDAGCELVRLTAPSINEANNLAKIKAVYMCRLWPIFILLPMPQKLLHVS
jgi:(E)-4-hydroxy-3-methylbut-2-enyl-diphosphate synthase